MNLPKVIPVVVFNGKEEARSKLAALSEGGLPVAEITFRTPYAAEAISLCAEEFPKIFVGAGSVTSLAQAETALKRGAKFIVSPGISEEIGALCGAWKVPYLPCAVTPAEIMRALGMGIGTVKFFPAEVYGGLNAIKALSAPFPRMKFFPTGGVDENNLARYLSFDRVEGVGGSFMMKGDIVQNCKKILSILEEEGFSLWN